MADAALFRRTAATVGLAGSAVLAAAATFVYQPTGGGRPADVLSTLGRAPGRAEFSTVLFVLQGLAFMVAALAIGHLLRTRFPLLSGIGASLAALGGFADAVANAFTLAFLPMARDGAHRGAYLGVITEADKLENLFALVGLLGTVVGTLLLSIGLFRAHVGPRWVAPLLWAFLVLEFAGSGAAPVLGLAAVTLAVVAFGALGVTVSTMPRQAWATADEVARARQGGGDRLSGAPRAGDSRSPARARVLTVAGSRPGEGGFDAEHGQDPVDVGVRAAEQEGPPLGGRDGDRPEHQVDRGGRQQGDVTGVDRRHRGRLRALCGLERADGGDVDLAGEHEDGAVVVEADAHDAERPVRRPGGISRCSHHPVHRRKSPQGCAGRGSALSRR